jgi:hypothetical protein
LAHGLLFLLRPDNPTSFRRAALTISEVVFQMEWSHDKKWFNKFILFSALISSFPVFPGLYALTPGKADDQVSPAGEVGIVFMISTYHHPEKPVEIMRNSITTLKSNGVMVILERDPVKTWQTIGAISLIRVLFFLRVL